MIVNWGAVDNGVIDYNIMNYILLSLEDIGGVSKYQWHEQKQVPLECATKYKEINKRRW